MNKLWLAFMLILCLAILDVDAKKKTNKYDGDFEFVDEVSTLYIFFFL